jgi:hypothetical protein
MFDCFRDSLRRLVADGPGALKAVGFAGAGVAFDHAVGNEGEAVAAGNMASGIRNHTLQICSRRFDYRLQRTTT